MVDLLICFATFKCWTISLNRRHRGTIYPHQKVQLCHFNHLKIQHFNREIFLGRLGFQFSPLPPLVEGSGSGCFLSKKNIYLCTWMATTVDLDIGEAGLLVGPYNNRVEKNAD